eukprot:TRINITY_DN1057_c0_g1_i3.p1 TRINITY_DN1057_c0_g1~~TRINITY_DN1057_c0_g1_i3.p1  ORF type:complete len:400 (+),score=67.29 TRINITY_DN1057_c0_g1_i3:552-1751(+)
MRTLRRCYPLTIPVLGSLCYLFVFSLFLFLFLECTLTLAAGLLVVLALGSYFLVYGIQIASPSFWVIGMLILVIFGILCAVVRHFWSRISFTILVLEEACRAISVNLIIFQVYAPLLLSIFVVFMVWWGYTLYYVYAMEEKRSRLLALYLVFFLFWVSNLLSAIFKCTIAGVVAQWYFGRHSRNSGQRGDAYGSFMRAVGKSFGSLCFASIVMGVGQALNWLLNRMERVNDYDLNPFTRCLFGVMRACARIVVEGIHFINRFTYIFIAMYGRGFCESTKRSFELLERHGLGVVIVHSIAHFLLFVGELFGVASSVFGASMVLSKTGDGYVSPVTIGMIGVVSYVVFHIMAEGCSIGVDTVYVCYMEDMERNGGEVLITPEVHEHIQRIKSENRPSGGDL